MPAKLAVLRYRYRPAAPDAVISSSEFPPIHPEAATVAECLRQFGYPVCAMDTRVRPVKFEAGKSYFNPSYLTNIPQDYEHLIFWAADFTTPGKLGRVEMDCLDKAVLYATEHKRVRLSYIVWRADFCRPSPENGAIYIEDSYDTPTETLALGLAALLPA